MHRPECPNESRIFALALRQQGRVRAFICTLRRVNFRTPEISFHPPARITSYNNSPMCKVTHIQPFVSLEPNYCIFAVWPASVRTRGGCIDR